MDNCGYRYDEWAVIPSYGRATDSVEGDIIGGNCECGLLSRPDIENLSILSNDPSFGATDMHRSALGSIEEKDEYELFSQAEFENRAFQSDESFDVASYGATTDTAARNTSTNKSDEKEKVVGRKKGNKLLEIKNRAFLSDGSFDAIPHEALAEPVFRKNEKKKIVVEEEIIVPKIENKLFSSQTSYENEFFDSLDNKKIDHEATQLLKATKGLEPKGILELINDRRDSEKISNKKTG